MAYRPGAFDAYDVVFCAGPHQVSELERRFSQIGKTGYELREVGYAKLDGIARRFAAYTPRYPDRTTILVAPSWGPDNVLAVEGAGLVVALADAGFRVVVRPHPAFFESLYPEGRRIVAEIEAATAGRDDVVVERSIVSEDAFMEAAVMISDWSGASSEYAFATERPVLFMDVPPKANDPAWREFGVEPFEARIREEIGTVVPPGDPTAAVAAVEGLLADGAGFRERIVAARERSVYNFGSAARVGAEMLAELAD